MTLFRQIVVVCVLALPPAIATALWHPKWKAAHSADLRPHEVVMTTVRNWHAPILWIDARPATEYHAEHIPAALPLTDTAWKEQIAAVIAAWQPEMKIVVYCARQTCSGSEEIARRLRTELALPEVYFLHGGWEAWLNARN